MQKRLGAPALGTRVPDRGADVDDDQQHAKPDEKRGAG